MEQTGLSKDDIQALFENLELLNRLSEQCIASRNAAASRICHHSDSHFSDAQTAAETAPPSDQRQTTADASGRSTESRGGTHAPPSSIRSNAVAVTHVDPTVESIDRGRHANTSSSFHSTPVTTSNGCIQPLDVVSTPADSVDRDSHNRQSNADQRQLITKAVNRRQTARVSKR